MKIAAISELKAKLASYLRLVKSGEEIQIQERGVTIARLSSVRADSALAITPPRKNPASLAKYRFSVKAAANFDVAEFISQDRARR
jgi:antitoxin (DNA-binding transcriptional repressor) of toxin-antitoxin stability system